jgi:hypothetical protein
MEFNHPLFLNLALLATPIVRKAKARTWNFFEIIKRDYVLERESVACTQSYESARMFDYCSKKLSKKERRFYPRQFWRKLDEQLPTG